jgi:hypothetical protein
MYCIKCKGKTEGKGEATMSVTQNGRRLMQQRCNNCGILKSSFISMNKLEGGILKRGRPSNNRTRYNRDKFEDLAQVFPIPEVDEQSRVLNRWWALALTAIQENVQAFRNRDFVDQNPIGNAYYVEDVIDWLHTIRPNVGGNMKGGSSSSDGGFQIRRGNMQTLRAQRLERGRRIRNEIQFYINRYGESMPALRFVLNQLNNATNLELSNSGRRRLDRILERFELNDPEDESDE